MRTICLGLPSMMVREVLHLSPADRTHPAEGVSRAVDELFRMLRDRAGVIAEP